MSIQDYYNRLDAHDWYYYFSDDHSVYLKGKAASAEMQRLSEESPAHRELYDAFKKHMFGGASFGKPESPLPERPK